MLTDEKLKEIRARAEKATPGAWKADHQHNVTGYADVGSAVDVGRLYLIEFRAGAELYTEAPELPTHSQAERNSEFIAHARTDIPALLDELEALRAHLRNAGITRPEGLGAVISDLHEIIQAAERPIVIQLARRALNACTGEDK